jgi:hypothetical protein
MDQSAPLAVAKGTTLTGKSVDLCLPESVSPSNARFFSALAGGFLWATHGTVKGVPALGLYASSAALSSGIAGVTFFSTSVCLPEAIPSC